MKSTYWNAQLGKGQAMWSLKPEFMKDDSRYFRVFIDNERGLVVNFEQNEMPANPVIPLGAWLELVNLTEKWLVDTNA